MNTKITALLEEIRPDLIDFAQKIVQTRSFTCQEGDVAHLVMEKMQELGYDEVTMDEVGNVLGRIGEGEAALLFDGHMDTVGVNDEPQWSVGPFSGEIRDGKLYGRGSSDTKCPLVSAIYGAALAKRAGLAEGKAIYVSASAMEEDYDGEAVRLLLEKNPGLRPRGVVICEPTGLMIATGHRGRSLIEINMQGKSAHGSTPELGVNPVYLMQEVVARVQKLADELAVREGEHGSVALTNVYCNTASNNSVPQDATIILDRRLALGESEEIIGAEMDKLVEGTGATWCFSDIRDKTWAGYPFLFHSFLPAWEISPAHPLVQAAAAGCEARGQEVKLFKMGCCTNGVTTAGMYHLPSIVFGPGDLAQAHSRDEFCSVEELVTAVGIHASLCLNF